MSLGPSTVRHAVSLALRAMAAAPSRSLAVSVAIGVLVFLPWFTVSVGRLAESELLARAQATPLVIGAAGDEFDLVMSTLYFRGTVGETVPASVAEALRDADHGTVVPVHLGHTAGGAPFLGTTLDYLDVRGLTVAEGRRPAVLGEVVVGAEVARDFRLRPGDTLRSDQSNLYNLAGAYPLLLRVVGVLAPTGGPDDGILLGDVKTAWVLDGLLHGHEAVTEDDAVGGDGEVLEASLALFLFSEITPETLPTFHLHGAAEDWPLTAILVFPRDARSHDQVLGDFAVDPLRQAVRPEGVVRTLLGIVLRIQELLAAYVGLVTVATVGLLGVVLALVGRLRAREVALLRALGAGRDVVAVVLGAEVVLLGAVGGAIAVALHAAATGWLSASLGLG